MPDSEQLARQEIDATLQQCGWIVHDKAAANLTTTRRVALCDLPAWLRRCRRFVIDEQRVVGQWPVENIK
jgi:hypothetical protein